jgi:hypothetical protein
MKKSRRINSIGRLTARCQASAVCSDERAPSIQATRGRSRLSTRVRTKPTPIAVSPSVIRRIVRKSPPETE